MYLLDIYVCICIPFLINLLFKTNNEEKEQLPKYI